jgi:hypothetical protein
MKTIGLIKTTISNKLFAYMCKQLIYIGSFCFLFLISGAMPIQAQQRGGGGHHAGHHSSVRGHSVSVAQTRQSTRDVRTTQVNIPGNTRSNISLPARGTRIAAVPSGSIMRSYGSDRYAYNNGIFYRHHGNGFVVSEPPIGFRIGFLPVGFFTFSLFNTPYYYYAGAYYQQSGSEYVVVQPPLGALVQSIPDGGQQLVIDGNTYYIVDGVQYQAIINNGTIWYKVIKIENQ